MLDSVPDVLGHWEVTLRRGVPQDVRLAVIIVRLTDG